jgi:hypothetical protein
MAASFEKENVFWEEFFHVVYRITINIEHFLLD